MQFLPEYAKSKQSRLAALRIRHEVFCEELGWERVNANQLESDEYDFYAHHLITRDSVSNAVVGSVRLVPAILGGDPSVLPIERAYGKPLAQFAGMAQKNRNSVVEISRLVTSVACRRARHGNVTAGVAAAPQIADEPSPKQKQLGASLSLYLAAISLGRRALYDSAVMLIEPKLSRQLNWMGFVNRPIGEAIEHRGLRVPCEFDLTQTLVNFSPAMQLLHAQIDAVLFGADSVALPAAQKPSVREFKTKNR
jgi:N-acyl amino acid synthase of PEP-CTERM/exosortase system